MQRTWSADSRARLPLFVLLLGEGGPAWVPCVRLGCAEPAPVLRPPSPLCEIKPAQATLGVRVWRGCHGLTQCRARVDAMQGTR